MANTARLLEMCTGYAGVLHYYVQILPEIFLQPLRLILIEIHEETHLDHHEKYPFKLSGINEDLDD